MEHGSLKPVHAYLSHWAALSEIERHPATARAYHRAEYLARIATTADEAHTPRNGEFPLSRGCPGGARKVTWRREDEPDQETVAGGAPAGFLAEVEKTADELVRAAEVLHLHGPGYRSAEEGAKHAFVAGGFFVHMVTPRSELVTIWQVTPDPLS